VIARSAADEHSGQPPHDARIGRIAARQHGVVTHRQLAAVGITGSALTRRVAAGRLVRLYRGVFAVGHVQHTRESSWIAAVMACGRGSVLSHLDAAALWRIYDAKGAAIHVTTTGWAGRGLPGVQAHRARNLDPEDVTVKAGIPVTTVARTLIDLSDVLPSDRLPRARPPSMPPFSALAATVPSGGQRRGSGTKRRHVRRNVPDLRLPQRAGHLHSGRRHDPQTKVKVKTRRRIELEATLLARR
jgi:hypothetical protein